MPGSTEPRAWAKRPELFGKYHEIEWHPAERLTDQIAREAAQIQHGIVFLVREIRKHEHLGPWKDLAPRTGLSPYQLTKVLRGQAHLSLRHVAGLGQVFGILLIGGPEAKRIRAREARREGRG